jgi:hypothetical protein
MLSTNPQVNNTTKVIDGTATGSHTVGPQAGNSGFGENCQPRALVLKTIKAENVSADCVISLGFNSPDYDNIVKSYVVRPLTEALEIIILDPHIFQYDGLGDPTVGPTSVGLKVVTAATADVFTFSYMFVYDSDYEFFEQWPNESLVFKLLNNFTI